MQTTADTKRQHGVYKCDGCNEFVAEEIDNQWHAIEQMQKLLARLEGGAGV